VGCLSLAFATDPPRSRVRAVAAAAAGFAVLLTVALVAAAALGRFTGTTAWFGLVPAAIGLVRLWRLFVTRRTGDDNWISSGASIFAIVLATGGDNVAVYTPLFVQTSAAATWALVYLLLWSVACAAAVTAVPDLRRIRALQRYAEPAVATAFVAIGLSIVRGL